MNKNRLTFIFLLISSAMLLTSCDAIASIFEAGFWVAIISVVVIVLIIGFLIRMIRGR
ncbi:MAG: hypothetical protein M3512_07655 [Bacteroidota bacterium]|nr:hypothetical protein [Bacteroidota bacterium]